VNRSTFPERVAACQKSNTAVMDSAIYTVLGTNQFLQIKLTTGIFMYILRPFFMLIRINYIIYPWDTWMFHVKVYLYSRILVLVPATFSFSVYTIRRFKIGLASPSRETACPRFSSGVQVHCTHMSSGTILTSFTFICHKNNCYRPL
jgi:hypothetical protein